MKTTILFRYGNIKLLPYEEEEFFCAKKYFDVQTKRTDCHDCMVICRYSCLPYYSELEADLLNNNCKMINSYLQHKWIANFEYYDYLREYTPETWDEYTFQDCSYDGPFVVKGKTNSKKFQWNKMMFAKNKREASLIGCELSNDYMIGEQEIIFRKYIPLKTLEIGSNGLPFSNEWRLFFLGNKLLAKGYYWSIAEDETIEKAAFSQEALIFAQKIANIACRYTNFFVMDIAEKENGGWVLIELNDGQMSGLSLVESKDLYSNLFEEREINKCIL